MGNWKGIKQQNLQFSKGYKAKNEALSATKFTDLESVPDGVHTGDATKENHCETPREKPVKSSP